MRFKVRQDNQLFEVEINNLRTRPITVLVDGEEFEVWPEEAVSKGTTRTEQTRARPSVLPPAQPANLAPAPVKRDAPEPAHTGNGLLKTVRAPIPGVITSVAVQPGDQVKVGEQLCVLEAMKMNNSIRASRAGQVAAVHVSVGQHVKHNDILLEYVD